MTGLQLSLPSLESFSPGSKSHRQITDTTSNWSSYSPRTGYTYNSLTSAAIGKSPFEAFLAYQPPLFPLLAVPSLPWPNFIRGTPAQLSFIPWKPKPKSTSWTNTGSWHPATNECRKIWPSSNDAALKAESKKLSPHYI